MRDYSKTEIVKVVLAELKRLNMYQTTTFDEAMFTWWLSHRSGKGLRLSTAGHNAFFEADIKSYQIPASTDCTIQSGEDFMNRYGAAMNSEIRSPYFIIPNFKNPIIKVYDDTLASFVLLYGSMALYLDSIKTTRTEFND